ncbi:Hypothetical predicted protein [Pelobates cultripes]|uniref:Uncharacterized protein n=1 Tax=Pelobates cultripes TaxID=61616 RepID=A0AAD1RTS8_PELCU|nr:Hypothetical predicted protein [Pelobates cultripes]
MEKANISEEYGGCDGDCSHSELEDLHDTNFVKEENTTQLDEGSFRDESLSAVGSSQAYTANEEELEDKENGMEDRYLSDTQSSSYSAARELAYCHAWDRGDHDESSDEDCPEGPPTVPCDEYYYNLFHFYDWKCAERHSADMIFLRRISCSCCLLRGHCETCLVNNDGIYI